jgi:integral membrane protein (TIGR01906 family)
VRNALVAIATALVILGASIVPFTTPAYVRVEQDRSGVPAMTGLVPADLDRIASALLGDLVLWRGDFDVAVLRHTVLSSREVAHMRDVRGVFAGVELLVLIAIGVVAWAFWRSRADDRARASVWDAVGRGARGLLVAVITLGILAAVAFDAMFELFHRLFFSSGTYTFDPATDRLVQLFPDQFWFETTMFLAVVLVAASIAVAWLAARRSRAATRRNPVTAAGDA